MLVGYFVQRKVNVCYRVSRVPSRKMLRACDKKIEIERMKLASKKE